MPRKTIQKNLAYDSERNLYYAVLRREGRRYTRTFHSRQAALAALSEETATREIPGASCTLEQWLDYWLENVVGRDRAASTVYAYRNMARCHVVPALGQVPLAALTALVLDAPMIFVCLGLYAENFFKCPWGIIRLRSRKWINDVTRGLDL